MVLVEPSFGVNAPESVAGVARVGLHGVDVAVEALIRPTVVNHVEVFGFEEIHILQGHQAFLESL